MAEASGTGSALWTGPGFAAPRLGPAPTPTPGRGELVVAVRAVAVNPVDRLGVLPRRVVMPWLRYPAVLGTDVAGTVVAVGDGVTRFAPGDRVLGHAAGAERSRNRAAEGAFQTHAVLLERVTSPLPDSLSFEAAAVLPLALSTAAAGLFEPDQLALRLPTAPAAPTREAVVVWGGSTSVGMNAIQLARSAGYDVIATASPHNAPLLERLGAEAVLDYRDPGSADAVIAGLRERRLAGTIAIGVGSLPRAVRIARFAEGTGRVASAYPTPATRLRALRERRRGVRVSAIWGGTPIESRVGPAIYAGFLPDALAAGRYVAAPPALVVGTGLGEIPTALERLGRGVSAQKLVVLLDEPDATGPAR